MDGWIVTAKGQAYVQFLVISVIDGYSSLQRDLGERENSWRLRSPEFRKFRNLAVAPAG